MRRLFDWRARRARLVLPLLLLVTVICIAGIWRLRFDGDFARLNGVTVETRQDEEAIREAWGKALSLTTVVVAGADRETVLQQNEQVCAVLQTLQERQHIDTFSSIAPLMPSDRERANHLRAWRSFWTPSRQGALSNSLTRAAASLGFRTGAFDGFLERIRSPRSAVTGMESGLGRLAADFWSEQAGRVFISTLVKARDRESFRELRAAVQREVPGAMLLNKQALSDEVTRIARGALPLFGVLVALLNALLLYLLLGRIELAAITLLPVATGVFWTLGSLGLLGLPVDMSNFIFVVFVVGVGGDYSLFLVLAELEPLRGHQQRAASTGGAVTICAFTTLLGVGVLVLARHPALFSVGLTALLGISFSLLATLFLVPPCMRRVGMRCHASGTPRGASPPGVQATGGTMTLSVSAKRNLVGRFYRYQGPYVTQFVFWKMKTDPLFTAVETTVPLRGEILDLGCGYGIVAHWLTAFDGERTVRGVDFDAEKVRVAAATALANPRVSFERRDILEWPQYPACDCVLLCDVLHYFPREWKAAVLRKAFQALRPGGRLIVRDAFASQTSAHSRVAWAERWAVRLGQNKTRHGLHFESEETHLALLREAGFEGVETRKDAGLGSNRLITAAKCAG
jgi:SAM-dependent methyltransferase